MISEVMDFCQAADHVCQMLIFSHFAGVASDDSNLAVLKAHEMVTNRLMSGVSFPGTTGNCYTRL